MISLKPAVWAASPGQPAEMAPDAYIRVAEIKDDGSILTDRAAEVILAGLDQAHRLVAANRLYLAMLRRHRDENPNWTVIAARPDRYGRLTGQVYAGDGLWLQEILIQRGAARFAGGVAAPEHRRALLSAETVARQSGRGLWGSGHWEVYEAHVPERIPHGFRIVAGTIERVARVGRTTFLNFGEDWRSDFTAGTALTAVSGPQGSTDPLPLRALEGMRVRVRGIVRTYNGPYLELAAPDQIEVLGAPTQ